jgi:undecaprenyl-diphosphatase
MTETQQTGEGKSAGAQIYDAQQKLQSEAKKETAPRRTRSRREILFQAYLIAAISIFAVLTLLARSVAYFAFDLTITRSVQAFYFAPIDYLLRFITWLGFAPQAPIIMITVVAILYFLFRLRWEAINALISGAGVEILNFIVKTLIQRPRPAADLVHVFKVVSDSSFPSGHVMFYTAFYGFLFFLSFTLLKHSWKRTLLLIIFGGLVALVGISRIYVGEHWFSDVVAAYLLGSLVLIAAIRLYRWGKDRFLVKDSPTQ